MQNHIVMYVVAENSLLFLYRFPRNSITTLTLSIDHPPFWQIIDFNKG